MKLQTMTLPTGEFVILADGVSEPIPPELVRQFRDQTGAVAFLQAKNEPIEVVNARVDPDARRHEHDVAEARGPYTAEATPAHPTDVHIHEGGLQVFRGNDEIIRFGEPELPTAVTTREAIDQVLDELGFTPAGLVDHRKLRAQCEEVVAQAPRLDSDMVVGADELKEGDRLSYYKSEIPTEFGAGVYTGPRDHVLDLESLTIGEVTEDVIASPPMYEGPACPCWPAGASCFNGIARCGGCPVVGEDHIVRGED